jgi:hypothetical protein
LAIYANGVTLHLLVTRLLLLLVIPALFHVPDGSAGEQRFLVGLGYDFATGKYGTAVTTTTHRIPLVIAFHPVKRLGFTLEIPYISQSSSPLQLAGQPPPPRDSVVIIGSSPTPRIITLGESRRGLGDISLSVDYTLMKESDTAPLLRPSLYVKFPTTDEANGLGTGEFDFGAGIGVAKWLGNWSVALDGMYLVPGTSAQYQLDNYWTYTAAVDYPLTERLFAGLALSGSEMVLDGASNALETRVNVSYWPSSTAGWSGYLSTGLTDASADFGSGVFGSYRF